MRKEKTQSSPNTKYIKIFWGLFAAPFILFILLFVLVSSGLIGYVPTWEELENPKSNLATQVYSADGKVLGTFFKENRMLTKYEDLSPNIINALVATEDERFYDHSGIDFQALMRAVVFVGTKGGGSTITQQLAKQLFHAPAEDKWERIFQKFNEWVIAVMLEKRYTKEEILTLYLNKFDFLNLAVGIQSASHVYFNKLPKDLNLQESAMLIGMCKNPSLYNPLRRLQKVTNRRNDVLNQMYKNNFIDKSKRDSIKLIPIDLDFQRVDHSLGLAPYFREHLRLLMQAKEPDEDDYADWHQYQVDSVEWVHNPLYGWLEKNPKPDGTKYDLYRDGLRIYTTIDSRLQTYAENAVVEHMSKSLQPDFFKEQKGRAKAPFAWDMTDEQVNEIMTRAMKQTDRYRAYKNNDMSDDSIKYYFNQPVEMTVFSWKGNIDTVMSPMDSLRYHKYFLRAGLMSMDPFNGQVRAYVGGINFQHFQYDMVHDGRRQVGSTFKPILYSLALQEDFTPCSTLPNIPHSIALPEGGVWTPANADMSKTDGKMITLKDALAHSNNYISAQLVDRYSPSAMISLAEKMGITTHMDAVPSICLGTPDISLYEMLPMYCTFGNKGVYTRPQIVTQIRDKNGNVLSTMSTERTEVYNEKTAYLMVNLLEGVVNRGTSVRLRYRYGFKMPIYGKTGTTQNHSDGWFFGVTPQLASGVWVGGEDRSVHFKNITQGQGANMALPIWALYMQQVIKDSTIVFPDGTYFEKPQGLEFDVNCSGQSELAPETDYGLE